MVPPSQKLTELRGACLYGPHCLPKVTELKEVCLHSLPPPVSRS